MIARATVSAMRTQAGYAVATGTMLDSITINEKETKSSGITQYSADISYGMLGWDGRPYPMYIDARKAEAGWTSRSKEKWGSLSGGRPALGFFSDNRKYAEREMKKEKDRVLRQIMQG